MTYDTGYERRQAAKLGTSLALRNARRASMQTGQIEYLVNRGVPARRSQADVAVNYADASDAEVAELLLEADLIEHRARELRFLETVGAQVKICTCGAQNRMTARYCSRCGRGPLAD